MKRLLRNGKINDLMLEQAVVTIEPPANESGHFTFVQASASDAWVIVHNMGFFPNVIVTDSTGREVMGEVQQVNINIMNIFFGSAFAGSAYLS